MAPLFQSVTDLCKGAEILRNRRYGVIEMRDGRLEAIHLRPWPKLISGIEAAWLGGGRHRRLKGNRCLLYYNQPWRVSNFLTLQYIVSYRDTSMRTSRGALAVLDEIAKIKRSDAILSHVFNVRISDRLIRRWGWERHLTESGRRQVIKRFYGEYPPSDASWAL